MLKITVMPKDTLAHLLLYLAENEKFKSVSENLGEGVTVEEVRASLRELAREVMREASEQKTNDIEELKKGRHLTPKTKQIISYLSPSEEKALLGAFGLTDK